MKHIKFISYSEEETRRLAARLARGLKGNDCLALIGDFGAGKTTFVKGLVEGLGVKKKGFVCSPSFVILKIYQARLPVYHFDLYRICGAQDFESVGFSEFISSGGISAIEWADHVKGDLPKNSLKIVFSILGHGKRSIMFYTSFKRLASLARRVVEGGNRMDSKA